MNVLNYYVPWLMIFCVALALAKILRNARIIKHDSVLISLTLTPLLFSQSLYLLYKIFPKHDVGYYRYFFIVVTVLAFIFVHNEINNYAIYFNKLRFSRLDIYQKISISIIIIIFVRTLLWPVTWYDQIEYISVSHSYYSERVAVNEIKHPFHGEIVSGIRPAIPLLTNYFALINQDNTSVEKNLQFLYLYYFMITIYIYKIIYQSLHKTNKYISRGYFLLLTCFLFTSFLINGFKEIIIVTLILLLIKIIHNYLKNKSHNHALPIVAGVIAGNMSFIHFTGALFSVVILFVFAVVAKISIWQKILFIFIATIVSLVISQGEIDYFIKWSINGLITSPFVILNNTTEIPKSLEMSAFGINSDLDQLIKGKLQVFTQIQSFGIVFYILLIGLIYEFRKIIKSEIGSILFYTTALLVVFITNPFNIIKHEASFVFLVSPKYFLMILPLALLLLQDYFKKIQIICCKIPQTAYTILLIASCVLPTLMIFTNVDILKFIEKLIPLHYGTESYYLNKISEFWQIFLSVVLTSIILLKFLKINYIREKIFYSLVFLVPFVFFYNNNFGILETTLYSFQSRETKIQHINKNAPSLYLVLSYLYKHHKPNDSVLMIDYGVAPQLNYLLLTKHNYFFSTEKLKNIVETDYVTDKKYTWIVLKTNSDTKNRFTNYRTVYNNGDTKLLHVI